VKVRCSQCGASLPVMEREFYLKCPHCSARNLFRSPGSDVTIVRPVACEDDVVRLFPPGADLSLRLVYFPYIDAGRLRPFYSHPVPELAGYTPPAGTGVVLSEEAADPDSLIPMYDDPGAGRVVFHPFYEVTCRNPGSARMTFVDGVSGLDTSSGAPPGNDSPSAMPSRTFFRILAFASGASVLAYGACSLAGASEAACMGVSMISAFAAGAVARMVDPRHV